VSRYHKGKTSLGLLEQETVSGSGISWAVCKSVPRPRQITMPAPTNEFFTGRMPFLPPNQQRQSTEGTMQSMLQQNPPIVGDSHPSGCTVASGVVGVIVVVADVVVVVVGGVCNRSQMRTSKCTSLIFGVSIGLDPG